MMLRPASPNGLSVGLTHGGGPGAFGTQNASLLNHSWMPGFATVIGSPGTRLGRNVPLVPLFTSEILPTICGLSGVPVANVQSPLHSHPPITCAHGPDWKYFFPSPKGSS